MIDKSENKIDVMKMRQLFHDRVRGIITHEQVLEELDKIINKQRRLYETLQTHI